MLPCCDEAHFFDNSNGFVEVAGYGSGTLIVKGGEFPAWVEELRKYLVLIQAKAARWLGGLCLCFYFVSCDAPVSALSLRYCSSRRVMPS